MHKKNYLCVLQPQRSKRLSAATSGFISPLSAAVNTTINPNQGFESRWMSDELTCYVKTIIVFFINFTTSFVCGIL